MLFFPSRLTFNKQLTPPLPPPSCDVHVCPRDDVPYIQNHILVCTHCNHCIRSCYLSQYTLQIRPCSIVPRDSWNQPGFATMLLLMMASTACLTLKDDLFEGDTTADRQMASNVIELCEAWIGRQPRKRLTLQFFQLQCLLLVAKRANCVRLKQGEAPFSVLISCS